MTRRALATLLSLLLGLASACALAACGGDESGQQSGAALEQPPLAGTQTRSTATTVATTGTTTVATTTTSTQSATTTRPTTTTTQPTGGATTPTTSTGSSGGAPAGCGSAVGGFIRDVRVSGADCTAAAAVADAWFNAVHEGAAPDSAISAAGYACSGALDGQRADVSCTGSGGRVSFSASP